MSLPTSTKSLWVVCAVIAVALSSSCGSSEHPPDELPTQALKLELQQVFGEEDESGQYLFDQVTHVAVGFLDDFYVAETKENIIIRLNSDGIEIGRYGSAGEGPGQFEHISALAPLVDGRLVVFDGTLLRITVFNDDSSVAKTFSVPGSSYLQIGQMIATGSNEVVLLFARLGSRAERTGDVIFNIDIHGETYEASFVKEADLFDDLSIDFVRRGLSYRPGKLARVSDCMFFFAPEVHNGFLKIVDLCKRTVIPAPTTTIVSTSHEIVEFSQGQIGVVNQHFLDEKNEGQVISGRFFAFAAGLFTDGEKVYYLSIQTRSDKSYLILDIFDEKGQILENRVDDTFFEYAYVGRSPVPVSSWSKTSNIVMTDMRIGQMFVNTYRLGSE